MNKKQTIEESATIKENLSYLKASLAEKSSGVKLVAVSKFHSIEAIMEAYAAGQRLFGESRVQELVAKQPALPDDIAWHFIGTLQTNKVKYIVPFISMIQSVDTLKLIREIDRQAQLCNRIIPILIEVRIAEETSKRGFAPDECKSLFANGILTSFKNVQVCGLMGMATFTDDDKQIRREFDLLRQLFDDVRLLPATNTDVFTELSIGMSDDYAIAIETGSTMVRIGTSIFGSRKI